MRTAGASGQPGSRPRRKDADHWRRSTEERCAWSWVHGRRRAVAAPQNTRQEVDRAVVGRSAVPGVPSPPELRTALFRRRCATGTRWHPTAAPQQEALRRAAAVRNHAEHACAQRWSRRRSHGWRRPRELEPSRGVRERSPSCRRSASSEAARSAAKFSMRCAKARVYRSVVTVGACAIVATSSKRISSGDGCMTF
jgi:hypothetical protein